MSSGALSPSLGDRPPLGLTRRTAEVPLVGSRVSVHAVEGGLLVVDRPVGDTGTVLHRLGAP